MARIRSYYRYDGQGNTRQLTDQSGTVTDTFTYDAWGNEVARTGTTNTPFRWNGRVGYYWDEDTGTYQVRRRPYGPKIGRWRKVDPIWPTTSLLNPYKYASNSAVVYFDPSGMIQFFTDYYSRGNDDRVEDNYETALVTTHLIIEDVDCEDIGKKARPGFIGSTGIPCCVGDMEVYLRIVFWNSVGFIKGNRTEEAQFESVKHYLVLNSADYQFKLSDNFESLEEVGYIGATLMAQVPLGEVPCSGGGLDGSGHIKSVLTGDLGLRTETKFDFAYNVVVQSCGKVVFPATKTVLSAVGINDPQYRDSKDILRLVKSNYQKTPHDKRFCRKYISVFDTPTPHPGIPHEEQCDSL